MSGVGAPRYDNPGPSHNELQGQITHDVKVDQDLINVRDRLDRELARAWAVQRYSRKVLDASTLEELAEMTVESVVETFELESSALLSVDQASNTLTVVAGFALGDTDGTIALDAAWIVEKAKVNGAFIEDGQIAGAPWEALGLRQVIACPYRDSLGGLEGFLVGGVTEEKAVYFGPIQEELAASFVVFTRQMSSVLHNVESREIIREQMEALRHANEDLCKQTAKLQAAQGRLEDTNRSLERNLHELSSLHATAVAATCIRDLDQLLDTVLTTVVTDLGYDKAMIMLVDEKRGVLSEGRVAGAALETVRFVKNLELPLGEQGGILARTVLSGAPSFVEDGEDPGGGPRGELSRALDFGDALVSIPLRTKDKVVGVMAVDNTESGAGLTEDDRDVLVTLASQVAISIENVRLYGDLQREIGQHERAEIELRKAHEGSEQLVRERTAELSDANTHLMREIEERKQVEVQLQEAGVAAEAANRTKSQFLANMSHELRTPMNSVIGFAELILDDIYGELPEKLREAVGEIQKSGGHLLGLINDVLDISRMEAGRMELRLRPCAVEDCIQTTVGRLTPLAMEKGLNLETDVRERLPPCIFDPQRITQVLLNLMSNAIKFTSAGQVTIGAKAEDDHVLLWVADTGVGIPEDELRSIFSEFRQVESSITRETQGSGLGLAIARRFVEMHGGRIWVESTVGIGSTFRFTLPLGRS